MNADAAQPSMLTPDQALREIVQIEHRIGALLQRTGGLTWMIWGVINAGIFLTYEALSFANPPTPWGNVGLGLLWIPWVLMGIGATTFLWRSLAAVSPSDAVNSGRSAIAAIVVFLAIVLGGSLAIVAINAPIDPFLWATFAVGISAAAAGGSGLVASSRSERHLWILGGLCLVALTFALDLSAGRLGPNFTEITLIFAPTSTTALLFGGGLYTAAW